MSERTVEVDLCGGCGVLLTEDQIEQDDEGEEICANCGEPTTSKCIGLFTPEDAETLRHL